MHRVWRLAGTTPGRFTAIAVGLVVIALVTGFVGALAVQDRRDLVREVSDRSGPLSFQAQSIYRSLSDADATAANSFLSGGVEPAAQRQQYADDIAQATAALTASLRIADDSASKQLMLLGKWLPVYTGLIETARAYNRQGLPLGAAYLREASTLMRESLLPAAKQLFEAQSGQLAAAQRAAVAFPWAVLLLGLLLLAALAGGQVFVARRSNRVVNPGLALATLAALTSLIWATLAFAGATGRIEAGRQNGSAPLSRLATLRVDALQARADESLTLIARGDGAGFEAEFQVLAERLLGKNGSGGLLSQALTEAPNAAERQRVQRVREAARQWFAVHTTLRGLDDDGKYLDAVKLVTDSGPASPSSLFRTLDTELALGIAASNNAFGDQTTRAGGIMSGANIAIIVLSVLLVAGSVAGLQRRIREYL